METRRKLGGNMVFTGRTQGNNEEIRRKKWHSHGEHKETRRKLGKNRVFTGGKNNKNDKMRRTHRNNTGKQ